MREEPADIRLRLNLTASTLKLMCGKRVVADTSSPASSDEVNTRLIETKWFKMKDLVEHKKLIVSWVPTGDNLADFFTKKLPRERFCLLRDRLMGNEADQKWTYPSPHR